MSRPLSPFAAFSLIWLLLWQSAFFPGLASYGQTSTDANGITTFVGYNKQGRPAVTVSGYGTSAAQTTRYSYDFTTGNLLGVTDNRGHSTGFSYNAVGVKTGQSTTRTIVAPNGNPAGIQTIATTMVLDNENRVVQTLLPDGASTSTHYNAIGKVDWTKDALRRVTSYHYNALGQRDLTTYPDGTQSRTYYDENGQSYGGKDRSDRGSATLYDSLGRASASYSVGTDGKSFLNSNGNRLQSTTIYDDAGRAVKSIDELGHVSETDYNAAGEATSSTIYDQNNAGQLVALTSSTAYDAGGRVTRSTDALGRYSVPTYEPNSSRVIGTTMYNAAGVALISSGTHYDALGRVDASTDAQGHIKRMVYDNLNRLVAVIQASKDNPTANGSGQYDLVTRFGYDELGHKIWQQDAQGYFQDGRPGIGAGAASRVTRFGYDQRGRMVWRAMPNGQVEGMTYDAAGQLETQIDFRGFVTKFTYDKRGRMITKVPDARLQQQGEAVLTWSYPDENTRIVTRGSLVTTYHSDPQRGWLKEVEGAKGKVQYRYSPEGQKSSTDTASGSTFYGYDVLGRLATVKDQLVDSPTNTPVNIAAYDYDAVGNLSTLERGNGVVSRYQYDALNRLSDITNSKGAATVSHFHYDVRADGKRTQLDEQLLNADLENGSPRATQRSVAYGYDDAGKLTDEVGRDGNEVAFSSHWDYDAVGNRVGATYKRAEAAAPSTLAHTTTVSAVFNANDWLTSQSTKVDAATPTTQTWNYDDNGAETNAANVGGSTGNAWSHEGHLLATQTKDASGVVNGGAQNLFDGVGNRVAQKVALTGGASKTTSYLVDEAAPYAAVVEERAPDANDNGVSKLQARYVLGGGLAPLAMWRRGADGAFKLFYFVSDGQDSVRQLTNTAGVVTDSYYYDAWGNALAGGSGSTVNPFRYTGQQLDADGKYYLRARFYNPAQGRFLGHDPLMGDASEPATLHRYLYANDDGVNLRDPSGLWADYTPEGLTFSTSVADGMDAWAAEAPTLIASQGAAFIAEVAPLTALEFYGAAAGAVAVPTLVGTVGIGTVAATAVAIRSNKARTETAVNEAIDPEQNIVYRGLDPDRGEPESVSAGQGIVRPPANVSLQEHIRSGPSDSQWVSTSRLRAIALWFAKHDRRGNLKGTPSPMVEIDLNSLSPSYPYVDLSTYELAKIHLERLTAEVVSGDQEVLINGGVNPSAIVRQYSSSEVAAMK